MYVNRSPEILEEPKEPAEIITDGLTQWFREEIHTSSGKSRNSYLDDLTLAHKNLELPVDDPSNTNANKSWEHLSRPTGIWWQGFVSDTSDDYLTARQIFATQMLASGSYKDQIRVQSTSQEEFFSKKFSNNPMGIGIANAVEDRLLYRFSKIPMAEDFKKPIMSIEKLHATAATTVEEAKNCLEFLYFNGRYYIGKEDSPVVEYLKQIQGSWIGLAVDHIIFAAQERNGNLARVPMLHATSITDQPENPILYLFADKT